MQTKNYIGGEWVSSSSAAVNINPSDTRDIIGEFARATPKQLTQTVDAAVQAQIKWAQSGLEERQRTLGDIGAELMARCAEIGEMISREEGKPRAEGVGEVFRAGQFFQYYAAEALRQLGENADSVRPNIEIDIRREPVGVVAVISPWNFPVAAACWKIAPALAFGNAVVWKPSSLTPASAVLVAEIIAKQKSLPPGAFNLILGDGGSIGGGLAKHPQVDAISFTGSLAVGRNIAKAAAENLTKLQMEMGSKNPLLVMDDADITIAVAAASAGAFGGTGQKCTASSRLIVHQKIYTEFADKLAAAARQIKVGNALQDGVQMGPAASEQQLRDNMRYMEIGKKEAEYIGGGDALEMETPGYYMSPALFAGDNSLQINREEMFAPIACMISIDSYEHALAVANDTEFGLVSGIITRSLARAAHFRRHSKTGCVMVNLPTAGTDYHVPFGGRKNSSYGAREQGRIAAEFYTAVKTAYTFAGAPE